MMRTIVWILISTLCLTACNDFLEESSQDEIRPSTVDDMEQLLLGEVYLDKYTNDLIFNYTDIFTDDMQCNGLWEKYDPYERKTIEDGRYTFGWLRDMFDEKGGGNNTTLWATPYEKIKGCNVVIEYLDKVSGDEIKRLNLKGEARVMRAWYYFLLVNFFGYPYNYGDPEKNLGVPLKLDMGVTGEFFVRNTVAEVYRVIEQDLIEGNKLLESNQISRNYTRAGHLMAKALLSRVYLYMENWDKAFEWADAVIKQKPTLLNLSKINSRTMGVYRQVSSDEIIWARPTYNEGKGERMRRPPFGVSDDFAAVFNYTLSGERAYHDLRVDVYIFWQYDMYGGFEQFMYSFVKDPDDGNDGIRTAEMYLNRAEAAIHKYIESGKDEYRVQALADLNYLREHRCDTEGEVYEPVEISDADVLLEFCRKERRLELCGESNHRWFDLRRYGMPELKHVYFIDPGEEQEFVLEKASPRYVLPIPQKVLEQNPKLEPNL